VQVGLHVLKCSNLSVSFFGHDWIQDDFDPWEEPDHCSMCGFVVGFFISDWYIVNQNGK
jgi:hypothetical protein